MAPSQLKQLKSSLRQQGLVGPQQSKKQKKQISKNGGVGNKRIQREVALENIREQFNPFEYRAPARGTKFEITSNKTHLQQQAGKGRPGVTKGLGEERVSWITGNEED